ncbi:thioredoxin-like domain-containing protein [Calothrix sp. 336/3]|uniref:thioredoxin-like domain-containing protein n=1 Tax=Calothrix sp. 336/3 TaxID=1337936 RepID=UPI0004E41E24|nr:thioredoxin-like domain-containing protein [Calothrix sp. 336/3]AKG22377.1 NHL repeat containing protein [Calothrix sp. 336/3]
MSPRIRAPEFPEKAAWLNTNQPLFLKELRGSIVLLDFWTYCCINCLHILPDLKYLEHKYQDSLTVIGVHSGKFDHEKEVENIRQAILRYDIEHPVIVDSGFHVWQNYVVRAYPTMVVIDPQGYIVTSVSGEGHREFLSTTISHLIQEYQDIAVSQEIKHTPPALSRTLPLSRRGLGKNDKQTINFQILENSLEKQNQPLITPLVFPGKVLATDIGLFISDTGHHRLVWVDFNGDIIQVIGSGKAGLVDGNFQSAEFSAPQGVVLDRENHILYVADTGNHAIRRIDLQQQSIETIAGNGNQNRHIFPHGGVAQMMELNSPWDLVKSGDRLYIAMAGSHQIWVLDLLQNTIQTYAGSGAEGCFDGEQYIAAFAQPSGITSNGEELLIADSESSSIRGVNLTTNNVRTICGSGDLYSFGDRDSNGENVRLQHCLGVEFANNSLWIADTYNHKIKIVNLLTGDCQTILGSGIAGLQDGDGIQSQFAEPSGISFENNYLYVADTNNHVIRRVEITSLTVTTMEFPRLCSPNFCLPQL